MKRVILTESDLRYMVESAVSKLLKENIYHEGKKGETKWTYDACREEAEKYKTKEGFRFGNYMAYRIALKNGWMKDYDWLLNARKIWTYETCYNEAKKYTTKKDFYANSQGAYEVARKYGWLKDYDWLISYLRTKNGPEVPLEKTYGRKWTYETCYEEAKKYTTLSEFYHNANSCYEIARRSGWLKDFTWLDGIKKWTRETCYEEAKKYTTKSEFREKSPGAYGKAYRSGWLKDYTWLDRKRKWTRETCYAEAKKYKTTRDFWRQSPVAYVTAKKNGWLKDYDWLTVTKQGQSSLSFSSDFMKKEADTPIKKWTKEECYQEAKKYRTKSSFARKSPRAYSKAFSRKWINDYTWLR